MAANRRQHAQDAREVRVVQKPLNHREPIGGEKLKTEPTACCRRRQSLVDFLARHPTLQRLVAMLGRSWLADRIAGAFARAIVHWYRGKTVDYRTLLESHLCAGQPFPHAAVDSDCEFAAGIGGRSAMLDQLAAFLQSLECLPVRTRAGMLKTWLHSAVFDTMLREADFQRDRQQGRPGLYPLDALVAPFGHCNLACRGCYAARVERA